MIIWGFKNLVSVLATTGLTCGRCGHHVAHRLQSLRRVFTLFFIPLVPLSRTYLLDCTYCGLRSKVTREQADQIVAAAQGQQLGQAHPAQGYPQQGPPQGHPQQPPPYRG